MCFNRFYGWLRQNVIRFLSLCLTFRYFSLISLSVANQIHPQQYFRVYIFCTRAVKTLMFRPVKTLKRVQRTVPSNNGYRTFDNNLNCQFIRGVSATNGISVKVINFVGNVAEREKRQRFVRLAPLTPRRRVQAYQRFCANPIRPFRGPR